MGDQFRLLRQDGRRGRWEDSPSNWVLRQRLQIGQHETGFTQPRRILRLKWWVGTGKDAIVFTKPKADPNQISVGLLSQTYLANTNAQEVKIPIVTWCKKTGGGAHNWVLKSSEVDQVNLDHILKNSPWGTEEKLFAYGKNLLDKHHPKKGTSIVLYNLRRCACCLVLLNVSLAGDSSCFELCVDSMCRFGCSVR